MFVGVIFVGVTIVGVMFVSVMFVGVIHVNSWTGTACTTLHSLHDVYQKAKHRCAVIILDVMQLTVQSMSEQLQAAANPGELGQQAGSPKVDKAVRTLLEQSQQGRLQGTFFGRLQSLAVVPVPEDGAAVDAVLRELCNLVSMP